MEEGKCVRCIHCPGMIFKINCDGYRGIGRGNCHYYPPSKDGFAKVSSYDGCETGFKDSGIRIIHQSQQRLEV